MIDLLSKKSTKGELALDLAKQLLQCHEWGRAKKEIERALTKGNLVDTDAAMFLYNDVCSRLGVRLKCTDKDHQMGQ
jgi:hypothetical protein